MNFSIDFQFGLTRGLFDNLIDSRDLFVEDTARPPFFSMEDVDVYSGKAFSSIYYLLLESLANLESSEIKGHARHAANQVMEHPYMTSDDFWAFLTYLLTKGVHGTGFLTFFGPGIF